MKIRAYLDIETSFAGDITVVGIFVAPDSFVQLVGGSIEENTIMTALDNANVIVTFNGSRFDLPVIKRKTGLDLRKNFKSHDLMYDCWKNNLHGGLKAVEMKLGICRETEGVSGRDALFLWDRYDKTGDNDALDLLLKYTPQV